MYIFRFFAGHSRGSGALREWLLRPQEWFSVIKKNQKFFAPVRPPRLCDPTPRPPRPALMSCDPTPRPPPCRDNRRNTRPAGSRGCRSTPINLCKKININYSYNFLFLGYFDPILIIFDSFFSNSAHFFFVYFIFLCIYL